MTLWKNKSKSLRNFRVNQTVPILKGTFVMIFKRPYELISEYVNWLLSFVRIVSSIIFKTSSLGNNIPTLLFQLLIIISHHFLNRINIITMDYSPLLRSLSFWYSKYQLKSHHKSEWTLFYLGRSLIGWTSIVTSSLTQEYLQRSVFIL